LRYRVGRARLPVATEREGRRAADATSGTRAPCDRGARASRPRPRRRGPQSWPRPATWPVTVSGSSWRTPRRSSRGSKATWGRRPTLHARGPTPRVARIGGGRGL